MKKTSKALSLLLALLVVLSLGVTAFADDAATGTIEVNYANSGEQYTAYQLFAYDSSKKVYYVSNTSNMYTFLTGTIGLSLTQDDGNTGRYILKLNDDGTFKTSTGSMTDKELTAALKEQESALISAADSGTTYSGTATSNGNADSATISNVTPGYYYVASNAGSIVAVEAGKISTIVEKASVPNMSKGVRDGDSGEFELYTTADVIDTVTYQLEINIGNNQGDAALTADFTITDILPPYFETVKGTDGTTPVITVSATGGTLDTTAYTVSSTTDSNGVETMTITLDKDALNKLTAYSYITITYQAKVANGHAADVEYGATGNTNSATLTGGGKTVNRNAKVKTYSIGYTDDDTPKQMFYKVDGTTTAVLSNVEFQLKKDVSGTTYYAVLDGSGYLTEWTNDSNNATDISTDSNGCITVHGLAAGTYTLTETKALEGYNLLTEDIIVTINGETDEITYNMEGAYSDTNTGDTDITIANNKGTELPQTGGIGTTVFYVVGGLMVAAALILLITKKRMSGYQD